MRLQEILKLYSVKRETLRVKLSSLGLKWNWDPTPIEVEAILYKWKDVFFFPSISESHISSLWVGSEEENIILVNRYGGF